MSAKSNENVALDQLIHYVRVPNDLLADGTLELTLSDWGKNV